nr:synaptobrevin, longin-like domain protein [Tanacetum cinerariifolium]
MIAILKKYEHNTDFHQIVDFVEAFHLRYALTINPTIYVSHIQQFWSTARIETTDEGTKILATVDGKPRTISESSIRRNLKLKDEARISSLPNAELFENLTLMGYNILPNQKFSFQKGQFSHQWKYLIHTIMQCLSPKNTGFNEFNSNIATALVCLATNRVYNFSKMIFDGMVRDVNNKVSKFLMYPRQYTRRARIAQSSALPTVADEPASPLGDDSQGEACPTDSGLEAEQHRANITKTSTLPNDSTPRVTSLAADEGSMQQKLNELTDLYTRLQRQQDEMASKTTAQDLEIYALKARIKHLENRDGGDDDPSGEDATIIGRSLETEEEACIERSTKKGSHDIEEMVNVLTSLDAASVLSSGVQVSVSLAAEVATVSVPLLLLVFPLAVMWFPLLVPSLPLLLWLHPTQEGKCNLLSSGISLLQ